MSRMLAVGCAVCLMVFGVQGQATNAASWAVSAPMSVSAVAKRVDAINFVRLPDGKMRATVYWSWLDGAGVVVRTGSTVLSQADVVAALGGSGWTVKQLREALVAVGGK